MKVATLLEPGLEQIRTVMSSLDNVADAFEVRLDALKAPVQPSRIRALSGKPLIGTVRRAADGGQYAGPEHDRLALLERCLEAGFEFVDVEEGTAVAAPDERVIRSRHDFRRTPPREEILRRAEESTRNGAAFKLAAKTRSFADTLALLAAGHELRRRGIPFAVMGLGGFPRALASLYGPRFLYGGGRTNAPGQPALADIVQELTHWGNPAPADQVYLVVGDPVDHSLSPRIHNAAFRHDGIPAAYAALRVQSAVELKALLAKAPELGVGGLSVTTPLKDAALELSTKRTPEADRARAVNCVRLRGGAVEGHNTDGLGARRIVERLLPGRGAVLVAGTGGAARALLAALDGFRVTVAGRDAQRLREVGRAYGVETLRLRDAEPGRQSFDLVINATRVPEPIPLGGFGGALFDLRYNSLPTAWEQAARSRRLKFAGGRELLLEQGMLAYEFWTGRAAPREAMVHALEASP